MPARKPSPARPLAPLLVALLAFAAHAQQVDQNPSAASRHGARSLGSPQERHLQRAKTWNGDLRSLPQTRPTKFERQEFGEVEAEPRMFPGTDSPPQQPSQLLAPLGPSAPAPAPLASFDGLDFANWGAGHPPDTNGDVGPNHYIQTVNSSIGVYSKSGARLAAFTFDTLMSQGQFGNLCDTNNFGDPVVVYDTFEDRWIVTDFAFTTNASGNPNLPYYQCFAVSKSGDPVSGGWNFYSISFSDLFGDYPKFGIWPDGLYMTFNGFSAGGSFGNSRVIALNKQQMYAGAPTVQSVSFDAPSAEFTVLPANARLQSGTPPAGSPNYYAVVWQYLNVVSIYKFHVDWNSISASTFTGPFSSTTATSWSQMSASSIASPANSLDTLYPRLMMQNQYTNIGGVESVWDSHTVGASGTTSTQAAVRYYQVKLTGGTVESNASQAFTWSPDTSLHRFMPSLAVNRNGDMAIGYSTSNGTNMPAMRYAARLAGDAANSLSQTETVLIQGTGSQSGNCGSSSCTRWGDYSAMSLDPDGCTFWFTSEYYATSGLNDLTRIGSFKLPGCTPVGAGGTIHGVITDSAGLPLGGAAVTLGSRTATTLPDGSYSIGPIPAGTYPSLAVSLPGFLSQSASGIAVADGGSTPEDFSLQAVVASRCVTDTTQADFQLGVPATGCDLTTTPDSVQLSNAAKADQQNQTVSPTGFVITNTTWAGQTFTPAASGKITRVDVELFCSGCSGTNPDITVSIRSTTGTTPVPTGADLGVATLPGFNDGGAGGLKTVTFATPVSVTAGTRYALIFRSTAARTGSYAYTCSCATTGFSNSNPYTSGQRVTSSNSGSTWTADTTTGGRDLHFVVWVSAGYASSATFTSSAKDSNPAPGASVAWSNIADTFSGPSGTNVQLQVAASNSPYGPFNFSGPFNSGDSLSQFNGFRYLKYQATLSTNSNTATPLLNDVTVCYAGNAGASTSLAVGPASGSYGGTTTLSATLSGAGLPLSGSTVRFALNGRDAGSAITDVNGTATVSGVSLAGLNAGSYDIGTYASFGGSPVGVPATSGGLGASSGTGSLIVAKADQAISFGTVGGKTALDDPFALTATGGASGNAVVFTTSSTACSVSGNTVTINGAGTCAIDANQAGTANYNAAPQVEQSFDIAAATQSIDFPALTDFSWNGGSASLGATATSKLSVSYSVISGPCAINSGVVTSAHAGACVIAADQAGDARYGAATRVQQTVNVTKESQAISFGALSDKVATDASVTLSATGGASGNDVVFSTSSAFEICSVSGTTVFIHGAGTCSIDANQAGNGDWSAAAQVTQGFTIVHASQSITFPALLGFIWNSGSATLAASTTSPLDIVYSVVSGPCQVANGAVTALGAGDCVIAADQPGDARYSAAERQTQTVTAAKAAQAISFDALADKVATDDSFDLSATGGGSANAIVFTTQSTACTIEGSTVTLVTAGSCAIDANQAGDDNYLDATQVTQTFTISLATQSVDFTAVAPFSWHGGAASLNASATSGLAVAFSVVSGPCSLFDPATLVASAAGSCVVSASQPGDARHAAAAQQQTVTVLKALQVISFAALESKAATDAPFTISATGGDSGNPVVFSTQSTACSVSSNTVTLKSTGTCTIDADQAGDTNWFDAVRVSQSFVIAAATQSIDFAQTASFPYGASVDLSATATSGLEVAFSVVSGPCTINNGKLSATGVGDCVIAADQAGDDHFAPATRVQQTVTVVKANQAISFAALSDRAASDADFNVSATGGASGNAVVFSTQSTACSVSGSKVTLNGEGTCAVHADQAGNANYNAAPRVTQSFNVSLGTQSIAFPAISAFSWKTGSATLAATASSGLPVTYAATAPCVVTGTTLTATAAGTCTVSADQTGSAKYSAAPQATATVTIGKAAQAIAFGALADHAATDASFQLNATGGGATSPVVFSTASTACSVTAGNVMLLTAGSCTIAADQAGDDNYLDAPQVTQTFAIAAGGQAITFPAVGAFSWSGGSAALAATSSSGLAVSYSVVSGPCQLNGATLTATGAGTCVVAADQAGNARFGAAAQATVNVTIGKAAQAIAFDALADKVATDAAFTLSAVGGGSTSAVVFSTASTACSVSGNTVTLLAAGSCAISADQDGDANYDAASQVTRTFTVSLASQTITFPSIETFEEGTGSATVSATASSGLPVAYSVVSGPCKLTGTTLTATAKGTCVIAADQAGDAKYAAASRVTSSVVVTDVTVRRAGGCATERANGSSAFGLALLAGLALLRRKRREE